MVSRNRRQAACCSVMTSLSLLCNRIVLAVQRAQCRRQPSGCRRAWGPPATAVGGGDGEPGQIASQTRSILLFSSPVIVGGPKVCSCGTEPNFLGDPPTDEGEAGVRAGHWLGNRFGNQMQRNAREHPRHSTTRETPKPHPPAETRPPARRDTATGRLITQRSQVRILSPLLAEMAHGNDLGTLALVI
jgi:hypothetical protein